MTATIAGQVPAPTAGFCTGLAVEPAAGWSAREPPHLVGSCLRCEGVNVFLADGAVALQEILAAMNPRGGGLPRRHGLPHSTQRRPHSPRAAATATCPTGGQTRPAVRPGAVVDLGQGLPRQATGLVVR